MRRIALALGAIVAAFLVGRLTAPTRTVTVTKVETREVERRDERHAEQAATNVQVREVAGPVVTRWRTERVVVDGQCVERAEAEQTAGATEKATATATTAAKASSSALERTSSASRESMRLTEAQARWALGVAAGLDLDGGRHWGGYGRMRVVGPLEAGVLVVDRTGLLTVGLTW